MDVILWMQKTLQPTNYWKCSNLQQIWRIN